MAAANDDEPITHLAPHPAVSHSETTLRLRDALRAQGYTPELCSRTLDMLDHYHIANTQACAELMAALTTDTRTPYGRLTQSLEIANAALHALAHEFNVTQKPTVETIRTALSKTPDIVPKAQAATISDMRAAVATFDQYHAGFNALATKSTELASLWTRHHNCLRFIEEQPDHNAPNYKHDLGQKLRQQGFSGPDAMRIANHASVGAQQLYIQQAVSEDLQALRQSIHFTSGNDNDPSSGLAQLVGLATAQLERADAALQELYVSATARHQADKGKG